MRLSSQVHRPPTTTGGPGPISKVFIVETGFGLGEARENEYRDSHGVD
jgi:hypothetical protein